MLRCKSLPFLCGGFQTIWRRLWYTVGWVGSDRDLHGRDYSLCRQTSSAESARRSRALNKCIKLRDRDKALTVSSN